jgi:cytochrome P450
LFFDISFNLGRSVNNYYFGRFTAEEKAKRPQLSHMPFGFGPRNCIGMRLALLQAKIALIELLKRYTFIRAPETEVYNYKSVV